MRKKKILLALAAAVALLGAGTAAQAQAPAQGIEVRLSGQINRALLHEISRGPGLFTGPQGEFVLSSEDYRAYQEWRRSRETEGK
jgi:hypothetical protein